MARDMAEKRREASAIVHSQLKAGANIPRIIKEVELQMKVMHATAKSWVEDVLYRMADDRRGADEDNLKLTVLEAHLISVLELAKETKDPKTALAVLKEMRMVYGFRDTIAPPEPPQVAPEEPKEADPPASKGDIETLSTEELQRIASQGTHLELTSKEADRLVADAEAKH